MISNLKIGNTPEYAPAKIIEEERYKHVLIMGMPGAGKTALISNFWNQDCIFRTAKVLIDPSGFFAQDAYAMSGGIYCSIDNPKGINPMMDDYAPDDIADNIIECVNQVVELSTENVSLTVRMRSVLREAILWCVANGQRRLDSVVDYLKNRAQGHHETRQSLIDRINMFIQDERMRHIVCEAPPINWGDIIDNKRTFILDCHGMGEDKMRFIGSIVTHGLKSYLRYSRKKDFNPVILYCDECHNFINNNWFTILKEGRKYCISAVLATQDFANVPDRLTKTILSNVGTIISFKVGAAEATAISKEFVGIESHYFQQIPKYYCFYRTPSKLGVAKTLPPPFIIKKKPVITKIVRSEFNIDWFDADESCPA